jgi:integrating conjugative element protein (TIGR03765 family)
MPVTSQAELTVIYDSGKTKPTGIYLKEHRIQRSDVPPMPNPTTLPATQYPVTTRLSVGRVDPQTVNMPPAFHPLFIVGSDTWSVQWLQMHQARLLALQAVGILTDAKSEADLRKLHNQFPRLTFLPISADAITGQLPIQHYPVLITRDRIEQ